MVDKDGKKRNDRPILGRSSANTIPQTCLGSLNVARHFFPMLSLYDEFRKSAKSSLYVVRIERVVRLRCKDDLIYNTLYVGHPVERAPLNRNQVIGLLYA